MNITVYCRVTTSGPRSEFSTGIKIKTEALWDHSCGEFFDFCSLGRIYNKKINTIKAELQAIQLNLHVQKLPYGPQTIIDIYRGDATVKTTIIKASEDYLAVRSKLVESQEIAPGTFTKDSLYTRHLREFLTETKRYAMLPQEFKIKTAEEFRLWLDSSKSDTARHLEFYSRVLDQCVANDYLSANPLKSMKMGRDRIKRKISLDKNELELMLTAKFHIDILQKATHLFLYQCGNGFSYMDIHSDKYRIVEKQDGEFFSGERGKSDQLYFVPMFPLSSAILQLYNGELPHIDNQTYNRCLKQIAPMLGIKKHLTTHTARKTFATLKRQDGWSTEAISLMLGHASIRTTELYYIEKTEETVISELRRMGGAA